jgi:hypothetical protein
LDNVDVRTLPLVMRADVQCILIDLDPALSRQFADVGDFMTARAAYPHSAVSRTRRVQADPVLMALRPHSVKTVHDLFLHEVSNLNRDVSLTQADDRVRGIRTPERQSDAAVFVAILERRCGQLSRRRDVMPEQPNRVPSRSHLMVMTDALSFVARDGSALVEHPL